MSVPNVTSHSFKPWIQSGCVFSKRCYEISTFVWEFLLSYGFFAPARISLRLILPVTLITTAYVLRGYNVWKSPILDKIFRVVDTLLMILVISAIFRGTCYLSSRLFIRLDQMV